jgi:hypothetical protein
MEAREIVIEVLRQSLKAPWSIGAIADRIVQDLENAGKLPMEGGGMISGSMSFRPDEEGDETPSDFARLLSTEEWERQADERQERRLAARED